MLSFQLRKNGFNKKCLAEINAAQLPIYPVIQPADYKKSYEEDDLVAMRRHFYVDYDQLKEDWARYAQEIKSFLAREKTYVEILPIEAKIELLESKISRLTANETESQPSSK